MNATYKLCSHIPKVTYCHWSLLDKCFIPNLNIATAKSPILSNVTFFCVRFWHFSNIINLAALLSLFLPMQRIHISVSTTFRHVFEFNRQQRGEKTEAGYWWTDERCLKLQICLGCKTTAIENWYGIICTNFWCLVTLTVTLFYFK